MERRRGPRARTRGTALKLLLLVRRRVWTHYLGEVSVLKLQVLTSPTLQSCKQTSRWGNWLNTCQAFRHVCVYVCVYTYIHTQGLPKAQQSNKSDRISHRLFPFSLEISVYNYIERALLLKAPPLPPKKHTTIHIKTHKILKTSYTSPILNQIIQIS